MHLELLTEFLHFSRESFFQLSFFSFFFPLPFFAPSILFSSLKVNHKLLHPYYFFAEHVKLISGIIWLWYRWVSEMKLDQTSTWKWTNVHKYEMLIMIKKHLQSHRAGIIKAALHCQHAGQLYVSEKHYVSSVKSFAYESLHYCLK